MAWSGTSISSHSHLAFVSGLFKQILAVTEMIRVYFDKLHFLMQVTLSVLPMLDFLAGLSRFFGSL